MHVTTHHDRIWSCDKKERAIKEILDQAAPDALIVLVDAIRVDLEKPDRLIISDNKFLSPTQSIKLYPELWHIYLTDSWQDDCIPDRAYNCMMNRVCGERLEMLYRLHDRNLLDKGYVSFNCLYHDMDPDIRKRKQNYDTARGEIGTHSETHELLKQHVPIFCKYDPDESALRSVKTVVMESYTSHETIAFSEKIFRALQNPRPWLLYCSPGSVDFLRQNGFDVLDDVIDHSYDSVHNHTDRMDALLDELEKDIVFDLPRYKLAVEHNQKILKELEIKWPQRLSNILQFLGSRNQARSN